MFNTTTSPMEGADEIIARAVRLHRPTKIIALFSGGNDSHVSTHVAASLCRVDEVANIDTTTGIAESVAHARETASGHGWPLKVYRPPLPRWAAEVGARTAYEACVLKWGFPGPGGHGLIYQRLKERCVEQIIREHKRGKSDRIMLVTGCRLSESRRRMGHAIDVREVGVRVWVAPILHWHDADKRDYMEVEGLTPNPVTVDLCISGECTCGAFARQSEREDLRRHYPAKLAEIEALEARVRDRLGALWAVFRERKAGSKTERIKVGDYASESAAVAIGEAAATRHQGWRYYACRYGCRWGERPPRRVFEDRTEAEQECPLLPGFDLCWTCENKAAPRLMAEAARVIEGEVG